MTNRLQLYNFLQQSALRMQGVELEEGSTLLSHSLWCAQQAIDDNASADLVLASLLHDIGHFLLAEDKELSDFERDCEHAEVGAMWLSAWLPKSVTEPIRLHAQAKRYLFTLDSAYQANLSRASQASMQNQGGAMSDSEVIAFESSRFYSDALRIRGYDDTPLEGKALPDLGAFEPYF